MPLADFIKSADFKTEKHVPVIDVIRKDNDYIVVGVKVGKEVPHPNTPEHFIAYIDLYYKGEGDNFVQHLGRADFSAHGASIYTEPAASFRLKALKPGKLIAVSYCNLHGLWESETEI